MAADATPVTLLMLPGLNGSGEAHWQTLWERNCAARGVRCTRVEQRDWAHPQRDAWVAALDDALRAAEPPVLLVAHSLGCALTAHHAAVRMLLLMRAVSLSMSRADQLLRAKRPPHTASGARRCAAPG
jgi:predicted alpha/beta hydrolase family esterase